MQKTIWFDQEFFGFSSLRPQNRSNSIWGRVCHSHEFHVWWSFKTIDQRKGLNWKHCPGLVDVCSFSAQYSAKDTQLLCLPSMLVIDERDSITVEYQLWHDLLEIRTNDVMPEQRWAMPEQRMRIFQIHQSSNIRNYQKDLFPLFTYYKRCKTYSRCAKKNEKGIFFTLFNIVQQFSCYPKKKADFDYAMHYIHGYNHRSWCYLQQIAAAEDWWDNGEMLWHSY